MELMRFKYMSEQLPYLNEQNMTIIIYVWYNYNIKYLKIPENNVFLRNMTKSGKLQKRKLNGHPVASVHYTNYTKIGIYKTRSLQLIFIYIYKNTLKGRRTGSSHMII
jgi:hypothetical protein